MTIILLFSKIPCFLLFWGGIAFFFHFSCDHYWQKLCRSAQVSHVSTDTNLITAYTERTSLDPTSQGWKHFSPPSHGSSFFYDFLAFFPSLLLLTLSDTGTHSCRLLFHLWSSRVSALKLKTILMKKNASPLPYQQESWDCITGQSLQPQSPLIQKKKYTRIHTHTYTRKDVLTHLTATFPSRSLEDITQH